MRDLAILTFVTLDGVMQAPADPEEDRSGNFRYGGWAMPFWEQVMEQVQQEAMSVDYDLLLGRRTYDIFAPHFSATRDDPVSDLFNRATKYVVTDNHEGLGWSNTVRLTGDIVGQLRHLKSGEGPLLQVHGSWQLIQLLIENDLIDEYRLWTFPVTIGEGKRLFPVGNGLRGLTLIKNGATSNGVTMSIYRRKR